MQFLNKGSILKNIVLRDCGKSGCVGLVKRYMQEITKLNYSVLILDFMPLEQIAKMSMNCLRR